MQIIDAQIHLWTKGTVVPPVVQNASGVLVTGTLARNSMVARGAAPERVRVFANTIDVEALAPQPPSSAHRSMSRQARPDRDPGGSSRRARAAPHVLQPHMKSRPTDGTMDWAAGGQPRLPVALLAGGSCRWSAGRERHRNCASSSTIWRSRNSGRRGLRHDAAAARP
jgi:hypothetical protein